MAGTYWLTILPETTKLESGLKDAVQRVNRDRSMRIEPQVDDTRLRDRMRDWARGAKNVGREIGGVLIEQTTEVLKSEGYTVEGAIIGIGKKAGQELGRAIGESSVGHTVQDWAEKAQSAADSFGHVRDAIGALKQGDSGNALQGVSKALNDIGQGDVAGKIKNIGDKAEDLQSKMGKLKGDVKDTVDGFTQFTNGAPKFASGFETVGKALGPVAATLATISALDSHFAGNLNSFLDGLEKHDFSKILHSGLGLAGDSLKDAATGFGLTPLPWMDQSHRTNETHTPRVGPNDPNGPQSRLGQMLQGGAGAPAPLPPGAPTPKSPLDLLLPPHAAGGMAGRLNGMLSGPGSGTSDSILGWPAMVRVSNGEFVTRAKQTAKFLPLLHAINSDSPIAALFANLLGFDDGGQVGASQQVSGLAGIPYAMGGFSGSSLDCSGLVSAVVNSYLGRPMFSSRMSTPSEGSWLSQLGAQSGRGGQGDLTVLWWDAGGGQNGHTEAILPNGQVIEATPMGVKIGSGTTPPNDSQWKNAAHFPAQLLQGAFHPQGTGGGGSPGAIGSLLGGGRGGGSGGGSGSGGALGGLLGGAGGGDLQQLGQILGGGVKESLGLDGSVFSDPTQWADVKSGMALGQWAGNFIKSLMPRQRSQGQGGAGGLGGQGGGQQGGAGGLPHLLDLLAPPPVAGLGNAGTPQAIGAAIGDTAGDRLGRAFAPAGSPLAPGAGLTTTGAVGPGQPRTLPPRAPFEDAGWNRQMNDFVSATAWSNRVRQQQFPTGAGDGLVLPRDPLSTIVAYALPLVGAGLDAAVNSSGVVKTSAGAGAASGSSGGGGNFFDPFAAGGALGPGGAPATQSVGPGQFDPYSGPGGQAGASSPKSFAPDQRKYLQDNPPGTDNSFHVQINSPNDSTQQIQKMRYEQNARTRTTQVMG